MTKTDLMKNLTDVKLIIGNGFDLHCKLSTSYRDYFLHDMDKNIYNIIGFDFQCCRVYTRMAAQKFIAQKLTVNCQCNSV